MPNTNPYRHGNCEPHAYSYGNSHSNCNSYIHAYAHCYGDAFSYGDLHSHGYGYVYAYTYSDSDSDVRRIHGQSDRGQHRARHDRQRQSRG